MGGDLSPQRLELAYTFGIFPWFSEGETVLWWFPDPRMVLFPGEIKVSKSMRSYFNQKKYRCTFNKAFDQVIEYCSQVRRKGQNGTWIGSEMIDAYCEMHRRGMAHSVEVWSENELAGGLYGVAVGNVFFGESMFSLQPNSSKFGLITMARQLQKNGYTLIDCQQETPHMASMGARPISAAEFFQHIRQSHREAFTKKPEWRDDD